MLVKTVNEILSKGKRRKVNRFLIKRRLLIMNQQKSVKAWTSNQINFLTAPPIFQILNKIRQDLLKKNNITNKNKPNF